MSALQCDVSTPFFLCGVNTFFDPATELASCSERLLLIGQMTTGTATPGVPVQVFTSEDEQFGADSMAAAMVKAARCQAQFADVWVLPLADFGTTGTSEVTISGVDTATTAEVLQLVVNGEVYSITIAPGDTNAMAAAAFALAIDDPNLTVSAAGDVLTIETVNGGDKGGWLDVRDAYSLQGVTPSSQAALAINTTPGVGVPTIPYAALGVGSFTYIANPYCDLVSQNATKDYICDSWAPRARVRAEAFTVASVDTATAQGVASALNMPQIHYAVQPGMLTPPYEATAAFAMAAYSAMNKCNDPLTLSNPICNTPLPCLAAPEPADWFDLSTADQLVGDGLSLLGVNASNEVEIFDFTTTYSQTDQGIEDRAFRDGQHVARLRCISSIVETEIQATYGNHIVRQDNYLRRAGQKVVKVYELRAFVQGLGVRLSNLNLIEDASEWSDLVDVQWDGGNSCVNITISPNLVNKLCCINLFVNSRI